MTERPPRQEIEAPAKRTNWTLMALLGGLVLLVLLVAYFATTRNSDQDKLTTNGLSSATAPDRQKLCASSATYDLIKRELFRRAAQLRGSDQAAYDQISSTAVVRMENPVMESEDGTTHAVNCSGSLSLDLPPGIAVVGGRRTLTSDIDYTVQQAADNSGTVVLVHNAEAIIAPLATLARTQQAAPPIAPDANEVQPQSPGAGAPAAAPAPTPSQPAPAPVPAQTPKPSNASPSFDCTRARTSGERAVCSDPGLARLDRAMTTEYGRAVAVASPEMRDALRQTAHKFYAYRDRCADRQCIADAYAGRIREIRDIVEGRWQPPQ
jgi:hypothetical protein